MELFDDNESQISNLKKLCSFLESKLLELDKRFNDLEYLIMKPKLEEALIKYSKLNTGSKYSISSRIPIIYSEFWAGYTLNQFIDKILNPEIIKYHNNNCKEDENVSHI